MAENTDIDLQEMSQEELASFINSGGQPTEETTSEDPETEIAEDTTQEAEESDSEEVEETQEVEEEEPQGQTETEDDIPEFYRGKSPRELVKMLEENKKYTSRQGNEIGQLRREITSFKSSVDTKLDEFKPQTKSEQKDFIQELISEHGYDEKDIQTITKIVEHQTQGILKKNEESKRQKAEETRKLAAEKNQGTWDDVKDLYPNSEDIENKMVAEIQKDPEKTLYKPGWVRQFIKSVNTTKPHSEPEHKVNGAKKRVAKASTVKTASRPVSGSISRGDLDSKDPETFRKAWNHFNPSQKF